MGFGYGGDDHKQLTQGAIADVGSEYPDIQMFSSQILSGASTEGLFTVLGAHKPVENGTPFWFGNELQWRDDVRLVQYRNLKFTDAYTHLGFLIHLDQDITVPAHKQIVGHGLHTTYIVSPNDPMRITVGTNADQFEKFASNNHVDTLPGDISFDQPFLDPKTGCNEKFWLAPGEDGNVPFNDLGAYGRQLNVLCASPFLRPTTAAGQDWFNDTNFASVLTPLAQRISNAQLHTARQDTVTRLKAISESLPPLVKDVSISTGFASYLVPISASFTILENRMPDASYTVGAFGADGTSFATIRDSVPIVLTRLQNAELPFKGLVSGIAWDGAIDGGTAPDGSYKFCITAKDHDGNYSPGPDQGYAGSCSDGFLIDNTPPGISVTGRWETDQGLDDHTLFLGDVNSTPFVVVGGSATISVYDTGSGLAEFRLSDDSGNMILDTTDFTFGDSDIYDLSLSEGRYHVYARDKANNVTQNTFIVDYGISAEFQSVNTAARSATLISRATWGVKWARLFDVGPNGVNPFGSGDFVTGTGPLESLAYVQQSLGGGSPTINYTFSGIPPGSYAVVALDEQGLTTSLHANSLIQIGTFLDQFNVPQTTIQSFSVGGPFFTPDGAVTLILPDQSRMPFGMSLEGVTQTGASAVWITAASNGLVPPMHFTYPQGSDLGFRMATTAKFSGAAAITVGYDARGLTPDQELGIRLLQFRAGGSVDATLSVDTGAHVVSGHVTTLDQVAVSIPLPTTPLTEVNVGQVNGQPEMTVSSYRTDVALTVAGATETAAGLPQLKAQTGLVPVGNIYVLTPFGTYFRPRATAMGRVDPGTLSALGVPASSLGIYTSTDGFKTAYPLMHPSASVSSSAAAGEIAATDASSSTYIALLGKPSGPITTLSIVGGARVAQGSAVVSANSQLQLNVSSSAFGVASTSLKIDQAFSTAPLQAFMLAEGTHTLIYSSIDTAGNVEQPKAVSIAVDGTAPVTTSVFSQVISSSPGSFVLPSGSVLNLLSTDPVSHGVMSGVSSTRFFVDVDTATCVGGLYGPFNGNQQAGTCANPFWSGPMSLTPGVHTLAFGSIDRAGNREAPNLLTVAVISPDVTPPATTLGFTGLVSTTSFGNTFVGPGALGSFSAFDPVVGGAITSGVATTYFLIDRAFVSLSTTPPSTSTVPFSLAEGTHTVVYFSADSAGNVETPNFAGVGADATAPISALQVLGSSATDSFGNLLVSSTTPIALSAVDPISNGVASGVNAIFYVVDADINSQSCQNVALDTSAPNGTCANELYSGAFTLTLGTHTVYYLSEDNVGNQEFSHTLSVNVIANSSGSVATYTSFSSDGLASITSSRSDVTVVGVSTNGYQGPYQQAIGQGLQLVGSLYNLMPGLINFNPFATVSESVNPAGLNPAQTALYAYNGTAWSSAAITGQQVASLSTTTVQLSGTITQAALFGVFTTHAADVLPPRTSLNFSGPSFSSTTALYVPNGASFVLNAVDDGLAVGDGAGVGVARTLFAIDGASFSTYTVLFSLSGEGLHSLSFYSVDRAGNVEAIRTVPVALDLTPPVVSLQVQGSSTTDALGGLIISSGTAIALTAVDPVVNGAASGVRGIQFIVDADPRSPACRNAPFDANAPSGTCANPFYNGRFVLAVGTHTFFYVAQDAVQNQSNPQMVSVTVMAPNSAPQTYQVNPATGPIGIPFTIAGSGFGAYAGGNTTVMFGAMSAPLSIWNDTQISGSVPGLSTGAYQVTIQRQNVSSTSVLSAGTFTVQAPNVSTMTPSSGPIGTPFSINGTSFGSYGGGQTRVLFDGVAAALSVWSDAQVAGSVPNLSSGTHAVWLERATSDGGLSSSATVYFTVTMPVISTIAPTSAPIGAGYTLTGQSFGPYSGGQTQVIMGGVATALSAWNDTSISGTVPGGLTPGTYPVVVQRASSDGGLAVSNTVYFQVAGLALASFTPATGPIGVPFTMTGTGFGAYAGGNTTVLFGGTTAQLSVWNDTTISGTVPPLTVGTYAVIAQRISGGSASVSASSSFTVTDLPSAPPSPSAGPIGTPFAFGGSGFGSYSGGNTRVLFGGVAAPLSAWNDNTVSGSVPALPAGSVAVWIERQSGNGVQSSVTSYFNVTVPNVSSLTPASAPIGAPFTITGTSFGPYGGGNTRVTFNGVLAPLSVWNDTTIAGSVPGSLSTGPVNVVVEIVAGAGLSQSATQAFAVVAPAIQTMTPTWGPTGTGVQLLGSGFGPYGGGQTAVLLGGVVMPLSVWNDTTIVWTVPSGTADGAYPVVVQRSPPDGTVQSASMTFTVGSSAPSSLGIRAAAPLASRPDWHFDGGLLLSTTTGGHIQSPSLAGVQVPGGALSTATVVTMARGRDLYRGDRAAALDHAKLGAAGEAISYGPEGTRFTVPVTLELPYDPALVPDDKVGQVAIHYYDPATKAWTPLTTHADTVRHVLTALTDHFSLYQPLGHGIGVAAADASFGFKAVYVFPNPVRGTGAVTFRVQPGAADSVEVRVYDVNGRKVYSSSNFVNKGAFDDGNGLGAQFTFENVWDIGGVGSGVYSYVITAKQAGQKDIHKTGRVGVVK
jgi:hypothetical protein